MTCKSSTGLYSDLVPLQSNTRLLGSRIFECPTSSGIHERLLPLRLVYSQVTTWRWLNFCLTTYVWSWSLCLTLGLPPPCSALGWMRFLLANWLRHSAVPARHAVLYRLFSLRVSSRLAGPAAQVHRLKSLSATLPNTATLPSSQRRNATRNGFSDNSLYPCSDAPFLAGRRSRYFRIRCKD